MTDIPALLEQMMHNQAIIINALSPGRQLRYGTIEERDQDEETLLELLEQEEARQWQREREALHPALKRRKFARSKSSHPVNNA